MSWPCKVGGTFVQGWLLCRQPCARNVAWRCVGRGFGVQGWSLFCQPCAKDSPTLRKRPTNLAQPPRGTWGAGGHTWVPRAQAGTREAARGARGAVRARMGEVGFDSAHLAHRFGLLRHWEPISAGQVALAKTHLAHAAGARSAHRATQGLASKQKMPIFVDINSFPNGSTHSECT